MTDTELMQAQDRAAAAMRAANQRPAWRKSARAAFDQAMRDWLDHGRQLAERGVLPM